MPEVSATPSTAVPIATPTSKAIEPISMAERALPGGEAFRWLAYK
jgi:hypothetical protein